MKHLRLLSIAIAVAGLASVAEAKPKSKAKAGAKAGAKTGAKAEAKAHVDKATKAHKEGKFDVALTELQAAYDIDPQPKLLFAIAQVQAKLGDCPAAVDNYNKFLGSTKDKQKQEVVKQAITACKDKPAGDAKPDKGDSSVFRKEKEKEKEKEATPPPPPLPAVEATPPAPPAPEPTPAPAQTPTPPPSPSPITKFDEPPKAPAPAPHHKRFYRDILGDVLVLAGVGAGAYSYIEYRAATKDLDDAEKQNSIDAYNDLVASAHDKRKLSVIFAGGGVALFGAGVLRWALHGSGESHAVAIVPTHSGGLITWSGGF